ncbi:MAG: hypothetical protein WD009_05620 [Phycisphaeraceae bacterium]
MPPTPPTSTATNDLPTVGLLVGWASADITPDQPVMLVGQFYARVSEGVRDPIGATAMAFESRRDGATPPLSATAPLSAAESGAAGVLVTCDLVSIPDGFRDMIREHVAGEVPELDPQLVLISATHTHTGPNVRAPESNDARPTLAGLPADAGIELDVMDLEAYAAFAAERVAGAIVRAWRSRGPAGMGFGLGQASVGYNRRMCFEDGQTRMYGNPNDPQFSHIEAGSDTSINCLFTWDRAERLTGVIVNLACPSQVSEHEFRVSADFWHETRQELRARLGNDVFILPQVSPAGDVTPARPTTMVDFRAQERMWRLMGMDQRRDIGQRIAGAVADVLPYARREVDWDPPVAHRVDEIELPMRKLSKADVDEALAEGESFVQQYEQLKRQLDEQPELRQQPRWYLKISQAYRRMHWFQGVAKRYERQHQNPKLSVEVHVIRLGDVAIASNPFEYYLDFGLQIKARSKAVQTLLVQLAGRGTYLPTARAAAGASYGAVPASTPVGPEGGKELVNWSVDAINALFDGGEARKNPAAPAPSALRAPHQPVVSEPGPS